MRKAQAFSLKADEYNHNSALIRRIRTKGQKQLRTKPKLLPEIVLGVVRKIGEQSLVNVEDPRILPIPAQFHAARKDSGLARHPIEIEAVRFAQQVVPHVIRALLRDRLPRIDIVGLDGESPAIALQPDLSLVDLLRARGVFDDQRARERVRSGRFLGEGQTKKGKEEEMSPGKHNGHGEIRRNSEKDCDFERWACERRTGSLPQKVYTWRKKEDGDGRERAFLEGEAHENRECPHVWWCLEATNELACGLSKRQRETTEFAVRHYWIDCAKA